MFQEIRVDRVGHVLRGQKARIIWIDESCECRDTIYSCQQCIIIRDMTIACPPSLAFLQKPQSHHILEEARRAKTPPSFVQFAASASAS